MFLNKSKLSSSKAINTAVLVLGSLVLTFWGLVTLAAFDSFLEGDFGFPKFLLFVVLLLASSPLVTVPVHNLKICGLAHKFSNLFETDADGIILMSYAIRVFETTESKLIKMFDKVVAKGFLQKCSLGEHNGQTVFVLSNGAESIKERFKVVRCGNCGAFSEIRAGFSQSCPFCGGPLEEKAATAPNPAQQQNQFAGVQPSRSYTVPDPGSRENYDIYLKDAGTKLGIVTQITMEITAMNYISCSEYVHATPIIVQRNVPLDAALAIKRRYEAAGATVELVTSRGI